MELGHKPDRPTDLAAHGQENAATDEKDVTGRRLDVPLGGVDYKNGPMSELAIDRNVGATGRVSTGSSSTPLAATRTEGVGGG